MKTTVQISIFAIMFLLVQSGYGDVVRFRDPTTRNQTGTITEITSTKVVLLRTGSSNPSEYPANTVSATQFDQEPPALTTARTAVQGSRHPEAIEALDKINPTSVSQPYMKADYNFLRAYASAKIAISNPDDKPTLQKAATYAFDFLRTEPGSYHFYDVCDLYGELCVLAGENAKAVQSYEVLAKAPWPAYSLKATSAIAKIRLSENELEEAKKMFQSVADNPDASQESIRLKIAAQTGLAQCFVLENKADQAVELLENLTNNTDPEDSQLQAAIYCVLGEAYEKLNKPKDAILAYLHVDLLYSSAKSEYVKALKRLVVLWRQVQKPDRAAESQRILDAILQ